MVDWARSDLACALPVSPRDECQPTTPRGIIILYREAPPRAFHKLGPFHAAHAIIAFVLRTIVTTSRSSISTLSDTARLYCILVSILDQTTYI
jgi:hypothetical protein